MKIKDENKIKQKRQQDNYNSEPKEKNNQKKNKKANKKHQTRITDEIYIKITKTRRTEKKKKK